MKCPICSQETETAHHCAYCQADLTDQTWTVIRKANPPDDVLLESLLQSFGIPVRLFPQETLGSLFPGHVGPLSAVRIAVPSILAEKAVNLLDAELVVDANSITSESVEWESPKGDDETES